ncbi:MAG TPA: exo-alpha-sialidase [Cycloclasticus sp.]|nr:exo-alpha-sialidase [Cycloclasticus sp.]
MNNSVKNSVKPRALGALLISLVLFGFATPNYADCKHDEVSVHCGKTPTPTFDNQGRIWTAFVQKEFVYVSYSNDVGRSYSTPIKVNHLPQKVYTNGENRPKIHIMPDGTLLVSWTEKTPGRFTGDIRFSRSIDDGNTYQPVKTINDDGLPIGHRFDSMTVTPSGHIYIAWLDKRDSATAKKRGEEYDGISLYYAISSDHGATFMANKKVAEHTCECCRIAIANEGDFNTTVMWRHIFSGGIRDHAITTLTPNGPSSITRATVDHWKTDACPHHGPDIDNTPENVTHLTWFSNGTLHKGIYYGTFLSSSKISSNIFEVDASPQASHPQVKQFNNRVWLIWKTFEDNRSMIKARESIDFGAHWSSPKIIASTEGNSDHPLLIRSAEKLILSWQSENEGLRLITLSNKGSKQ